MKSSLPRLTTWKCDSVSLKDWTLAETKHWRKRCIAGPPGSCSGEAIAVLIALWTEHWPPPQERDTGAWQTWGPKWSLVTMLSKHLCKCVSPRRNLHGAHLLLAFAENLDSGVALHLSLQLTWWPWQSHLASLGMKIWCHQYFPTFFSFINPWIFCRTLKFHALVVF